MAAGGPSAPREGVIAPPRADKHSLRVAIGAYPRGASLPQQAAYLLAIGGPLGYIPWVPATWTSLVAAVFWWWRPPSPLAVLAFTAVALLVGGPCCTAAERLQGVGDPRNVVWDEIAGQTVTFLFVAPRNWELALAGFVLFRILDIAKPFPARGLERVPGGWGVMLDDIASGLWAAGALWLLHAGLPHWF
ncbi:MAG: phosphatidylglycerophosphatase A family protein [Terriglobales bacterium]